MKLRLLEILRCPGCQSKMELTPGPAGDGEVESGEIYCPGCRSVYPIRNGIPRFVDDGNYASNFGFQWQRFAKTQLDSQSGRPISRTRFFAEAGWTEEALRGARILDAGCGAGRFAEVALASGAEVVAIDYSNAVDACWENLRASPQLHVVQADIYALPFADSSFDCVYSLGVLQHTPRVRDAFFALLGPLKSGGNVVVDLYVKQWRNLLEWKYLLRRLLRGLPREQLFGLVQCMVEVFFPLSYVMGLVPAFGGRLRYLLPVANYVGLQPMSYGRLKEWSVLDTFDQLSPAYDQPQDRETLERWMHDAALSDVKIFRRGVLVGRGRKG